MTQARDRAFMLLAVAAALAGAYHLLAACGIAVLPDDASVERHLAFVAICAVAVWYFMRRPLWGAPLLLTLVVQQTSSHGGRLVRWAGEGRFDALSLVVLAVLYAATVLVLLDARDRSPRVRRILCPRGA